MTPSPHAVASGPAGGGPARWRRGWRGALLLLMKVAVTVGLSVWIITLVDWWQFWMALRGSRVGVIAFAWILLVGGLTISAYKWQQLLLVHALRYRLALLVRWYLVAAFLNQFLPSSIGGDGFRIYKTWKNERAKSASVVAIVLERVTGMIALAILGVAASAVLYLQRGDGLAGVVAITGSLGLIAGLAIVFLAVRLRLFDRLARGRVGAKWLAGSVALIRDFKRHPQKISLVGAISFGFHVNKIVVVWLLLVSLGERPSLLELTVALFAVELAGLLPISIGGLGVVEGSFIVAMAHFGLNEETSLAAMLLLRVLVIPFSLVGAALYFTGDRETDQPSVDGPPARDGSPAHAN